MGPFDNSNQSLHYGRKKENDKKSERKCGCKLEVIICVIGRKMAPQRCPCSNP